MDGPQEALYVYETSSNVDEAQYERYFQNVNIEQQVMDNEDDYGNEGVSDEMPNGKLIHAVESSPENENFLESPDFEGCAVYD